MSTTATPAGEALNGAKGALLAEYVNPVIRSTKDVFEMMLGCTPKRTGLKMKDETCPPYAVSGVIGITGNAAGTIVVGASEKLALNVLERMIGTKAELVNKEVCDAIGELTNMIAGASKAQMAHLNLSISIPSVISGNGHIVYFPTNIKPFCVMFESEIGEFCVEVGFSTMGD
jgi:chemotaxis protein CheX